MLSPLDAPARDAGARETTSAELVTVVIPARNEEDDLGRCLDAVRAQTYRNLQIVVVDGGSTDRTTDVVARAARLDPRVELLHNERHLITISLNTALRHARGEWLVRVDAHSTIGEDYVERAVALLREGRWGGVGGRKDGVGSTAAGRAIAVALGSRFGVGGSRYHHGTAPSEVDHIPFGAYPVDLARRFGGWDERLVANEDFEFDHRLRRAGFTLLFDPSISISWKSRQSVRDLFRQYLRYGRGKADVAMLHPGSMRLRHLIPPVLVGTLAAAAATAVRRPRVGAAVVAPYLVALTAASATAGRRLDRPADRVWLAPSFAAMHVGWGIGFWSGVARIAARRGSVGPRR